jgi:hypothetical protein
MDVATLRGSRDVHAEVSGEARLKPATGHPQCQSRHSQRP